MKLQCDFLWDPAQNVLLYEWNKVILVGKDAFTKLILVKNHDK